MNQIRSLHFHFDVIGRDQDTHFIAMSNDLKACTEQLSAEHRLLMQLIYRNHNQHASSQLFSYFKNLNRVLKLLTPERVNATATKCEATLRSAAQGKVTQADLSEINETHVLLFAVVNMTAQGLDFALKASDLVRHLLGKKLFLPLYTILLAISARIVHCLSDIFKHFSMQCNALTLQLQVNKVFSVILYGTTPLI